MGSLSSVKDGGGLVEGLCQTRACAADAFPDRDFVDPEHRGRLRVAQALHPDQEQQFAIFVSQAPERTLELGDCYRGLRRVGRDHGFR
jgi:hypothetical protein